MLLYSTWYTTRLVQVSVYDGTYVVYGAGQSRSQTAVSQHVHQFHSTAVPGQYPKANMLVGDRSFWWRQASRPLLTDTIIYRLGRPVKEPNRGLLTPDTQVCGITFGQWEYSQHILRSSAAACLFPL